MARINDLPLDNTVTDSDQIVTIDSSLAGAASRIELGDLSAYILGQVDGVSFGSAAGNVAPFAQGNNTTIQIPANLLDNAPTANLANLVTTNTSQSVPAFKAFSNITVNGSTPATLSADQTFVGDNSFSGANTHSGTDTVTGITSFIGTDSLQTTRMNAIGSGNTTYVGVGATSINNTVSTSLVNYSTVSEHVINPGNGAYSYFLQRNGAFATGSVFQYTASNDRVSLNASTISVNGNTLVETEIGTWVPTFTNAGTIGTIYSYYAKVGNQVTLNFSGTIAAGSDNNFFIGFASLPFPSTAFNAANTTVGTWYTSSGNVFVTPILTGTIGTNGNLAFIRTDTNDLLHGDEILGHFGFSCSYSTFS